MSAPVTKLSNKPVEWIVTTTILKRGPIKTYGFSDERQARMFLYSLRHDGECCKLRRAA